jgi:hypothetical protein
MTAAFAGYVCPDSEVGDLPWLELFPLADNSTKRVAPAKTTMEGIRKKENKRRQSRRNREAEAKKGDKERQGKKKQNDLKAYLTREGTHTRTLFNWI